MNFRRAVGVIITLAGWIVVTLALMALVIGLYYRPTIEVDAYGRSRPIPRWVNTAWFQALLAAAIALIGGLCVRAGRRWRRARI